MSNRELIDKLRRNPRGVMFELEHECADALEKAEADEQGLLADIERLGAECDAAMAEIAEANADCKAWYVAAAPYATPQALREGLAAIKAAQLCGYIIEEVSSGGYSVGGAGGSGPTAISDERIMGIYLINGASPLQFARAVLAAAQEGK